MVSEWFLIAIFVAVLIGIFAVVNHLIKITDSISMVYAQIDEIHGVISRQFDQISVLTMNSENLDNIIGEIERQGEQFQNLVTAAKEEVIGHYLASISIDVHDIEEKLDYHNALLESYLREK